MNFKLLSSLHFTLFILLTTSLIEYSKCKEKHEVIIDYCQDANNPDWKFPTGWNVFCFDDILSLKESATSDKHNTMIPQNFNWSAFEGATGIWAFFHQDPPPAFDLPPPVISYYSVRSLKSLQMTYFMHGSVWDRLKISTVANSREGSIIKNECGFSCNIKMVETEEIGLDYCNYCNTYEIYIELQTTPGQSFVFIDKIVIQENPIPTRATFSEEPYLPTEPSRTTGNESTNTSVKPPSTQTTGTEKITTEKDTTDFPTTPTQDFEFIIMDKCEDSIQWEIPSRWLMFCFDDITHLKENASADPYNTMIPKDFNWSAFKGRTGIWGFFNQDPPPALNLPPPVISYKSTLVSFKYLQMAYYMYGYKSDRITISANHMKESILNDCGFNCHLEMIETERIHLIKDCDEQDLTCGTYGFSIALETTPGQSFVLIDRIVAYKSIPTTRPPIRSTYRITTESTTRMTGTTNKESTDSLTIDKCQDIEGTNWKFPTGWRMYCFENILSLKDYATNDRYKTMIPKDFNWSAFEDATGIWALFYQDPPRLSNLPPPVISYTSHYIPFKSAQMVYFMYGNVRDRLKISTGSSSREESSVINQCGFKCDQKMVETEEIGLNCDEFDNNCNAYKVSIALETTPGQSFVFIDKIVLQQNLHETRPSPLPEEPYTQTKTVTTVGENHKSTETFPGEDFHDFLTFDKCQDFGPDWKFPSEWLMFCFDSIQQLKENATSDKYNTMIPKNFNWDALKGADGIWGFFYQDPPPVFGLPLPKVVFKSTSTSFQSLKMNFFMYGNNGDSLKISSELSNKDQFIRNDCGSQCDIRFLESDSIHLGTQDQDGDGLNSFVIDMEMTPGYSFVLIDKIILSYEAKPQTTISTTCFPEEPATQTTSYEMTTTTENESTETSGDISTDLASTEATGTDETITTETDTTDLSTSPAQDYEFIILDKCEDSIMGWEIPSRWLMFCFDDINLLKENASADPYNTMIPEDFYWSAFQGTAGIWAFFHQDPPPARNLPPPVISYRSGASSSFSYLQMVYYIHGNESDRLTISTTFMKESIINDCGFDCDLEMVETDRINLNSDCDEQGLYCGAYGFSIALETTPGESFVLIDKIVAHKSTTSTRPVPPIYTNGTTTESTTKKSTTTTITTTTTTSEPTTNNPSSSPSKTTILTTPTLTSEGADEGTSTSSEIKTTTSCTPENSNGCSNSADYSFQQNSLAFVFAALLTLGRVFIFRFCIT